MEYMFIAIVTDDKEYGRTLSLSILSVCRDFIIRVLSAEEFLNDAPKFDLVLWDGDEVKNAFGGRIIYLADKPSDAIKNIAEKRFCIYKYSNATCIVASLFEIYQELTGKGIINLKRQEVRLFAFASYKGGCGCSTAAIAVGQEMCRFQGKKVLYISFEEFESTGEFIKNETEVKGVFVYLYNLFNKIYSSYHLNEGEDKKQPFIERHIIRDDFGIEAFSPTGGRNPLRELNFDEVNKFIAAVIDCGRYDVVIMDMGDWASGPAMTCLQMAERICIVSNEDKSSREDAYIRQIVTHCGEEIMNRIIKVTNNVPILYGFDENEKEEHVVEIHKCNNFVKEGGVTKIFLDEQFGKDINFLANMMMEPI